MAGVKIAYEGGMIYFQVRLSEYDRNNLQKHFPEQGFRLFQIRSGGYYYGSITKAAYPHMIDLLSDDSQVHLEQLDQHEFEAVQASLFSKESLG